MFCNEPIQKVWYLEERQENRNHWEYLMFFFRLGYYVTDGHWLVFQTENHFISMGADGVHLYDSKEQLEKPELELTDDDWYGIPGYLSEDTLAFVGERILNVTKTEDGWDVEFDHLKLALIPCTEDDFHWSSYYNYIPYLGISHNLKKCKCGGDAELMYDHVEDYYIRCSKCRKTTYADYRLSKVVKDWNAGKCPCKHDLTPFENFCLHWDKPIRKVVVRKDAVGFGTDHFFCEDMILLYDDLYFRPQSLYIPMDQCVFTASELSGYNPEHWPYEMHFDADETLMFRDYIQDGNREKIVLATRKQVITVTAEKHKLEVGIERVAE